MPSRDGGLVSWTDIEHFIVKYAGAEVVEGFRAPRFERINGETERIEAAVNATLGRHRQRELNGS